MADWPGLDELKQVLNVDNDGGEDWSETLDRVLASAIAHVKADVGGSADDGTWDELVDFPDESLAQAALRMAELMALRPEAAAAAGRSDPTYERLLLGHRRSFGFS